MCGRLKSVEDYPVLGLKSMAVEAGSWRAVSTDLGSKNIACQLLMAVLFLWRTTLTVSLPFWHYKGDTNGVQVYQRCLWLPNLRLLLSGSGRARLQPNHAKREEEGNHLFNILPSAPAYTQPHPLWGLSSIPFTGKKGMKKSYVLLLVQQIGKLKRLVITCAFQNSVRCGQLKLIVKGIISVN